MPAQSLNAQIGMLIHGAIIVREPGIPCVNRVPRRSEPDREAGRHRHRSSARLVVDRLQAGTCQPLVVLEVAVPPQLGAGLEGEHLVDVHLRATGRSVPNP